VGTQIPPLVHAIATGRFESQSIKEEASNRLFNTKLIPAEIRRQVTVTSESKDSTNISAIWREIRAVFDHDGRDNKLSEIYEKGEKILSASRPIEIEIDDTIDFGDIETHPFDNYLLLLEWGLHQLPEPNAKTKSPAPSKVLSYLDVIAKKMLSLAEEYLIEKMCSKDRADLYFEVISLAISNSNRISIIYALSKLDKWLVNYKKSEPLEDEDELFEGARSAKSTVNSNLITFDEYKAVKDILLEASASRSFTFEYDYPILSLIYLILGFRCGLRRSEISYLKIKDYIYSGDDSQIVIRESEFRRLKNKNAQRTLDLKDFLIDDEIMILNRWYFDLPRQHGYFFSSKTNHSQPVSSEVVVGNLMMVIRSVTGDKALKFHQLRHSFASWLMLSAMSAETSIEFSEYFSKFPITQDWLKLEKVRSRKKEQLGYEHLSKKYPYWIQKNIGHSSIETTLANYIHFMDIAISGLQCREWSEANYKELSDLTRTSKNTISKHSGLLRIRSILSNINRNPFVINPLFKRSENDRITHKPWQKPVAIKPLFARSINHFGFYQCYRIFELDLYGYDIKEIKKLTGIDSTTIEIVINIYHRQQNLNLLKGKSFSAKELSELALSFNKKMPTLEYGFNTPDKEITMLLNIINDSEDPLESSIDAIVKCLRGENRRSNENTEKSVKIIVTTNNEQYGKQIIYLLNELNINYEIILNHSSTRSESELLEFEKNWHYHLGLSGKPFFKRHNGGAKKKGKNDRLEISIKKDNGVRYSAFYFLACHLYVFYNAVYEI